MADYQILKITLNDATHDEKVYIRHEIVGSRTLGGNLHPPYPQDLIIRLHAYNLKWKGEASTRFDKAAAEAETVSVQVLFRDELRDCTVKDVNKMKTNIIAKFAEDYPLDWRERLLNDMLLPTK